MQNEIEIRQIKFGSDAYRKELELRDRLLLGPLGIDIFGQDLAGEKDDHHIGAFRRGQLVGILILTALDDATVKMRQVAVEDYLRGKNIGRAMVDYAEEFAGDAGYEIMVLNARKTAAGFYEKLGYEKIGEEFIEVTIPHYRMQKKLQ